MKSIAYRIIDSSIGKGSQDITHTEILASGKTRIRIRMKSDAYKFQSYARIELWTGSAWSEIHSIHHSKMATPAGLHYLPNLTEKMLEDAFKTDRGQLLSIAEDILGLRGRKEN